MTTDDRNSGLEAFFDAARAAPPKAPPGMVSRMTANAEMARTEALRRSGVAAGGPGWLAQLSGILGGWYGAGGLAAACAAGLWIGLAPPAGLPDPGAYWAETVSALDLYDSGGFLSAAAEEG